MTDGDIQLILYKTEKIWLQNVETILLNYIPKIQEVIQKLKEYNHENKLEYGGGDRNAWIQDEKIILENQNFKFCICDNGLEFYIKYFILDEYTKQHCRRMMGVKDSDDLLIIYRIGVLKDGEENKIIDFLNYENYWIFKYFMGEIESLITVLSEI